ncbi:Mut7-C RNAse domain-containing protein [Desulfobacca acetoxidans]
MKLLVDQTLGSLAKWLRIMGFDVEQIRLQPQKLHTLPTSVKDTYLLSRQTGFQSKTPRTDLIIVASDRTEDQLQEVCRRLPALLTDWTPLTRCSHCNQLLLPLSVEAARDRVPDYVLREHRVFFECPGCHRVFWEGSHQRRIRRRLQELKERLAKP